MKLYNNNNNKHSSQKNILEKRTYTKKTCSLLNLLQYEKKKKKGPYHREIEENTKQHIKPKRLILEKGKQSLNNISWANFRPVTLLILHPNYSP